LTHPAGWEATKLDQFIRAAALAGLGHAVLVPEPLAAAAFYAAEASRRPAATSAVYDLGGGTFDVAVIDAADGRLEVRRSAGLDWVGGVAFDQILLELVGQRIAQRNPTAWDNLSAPATAADLQARALLVDDVRTAKEALSDRQQTSLYVAAINGDVLITRGEFEDAVRSDIDATVDLFLRTVTEAKLRVEDLSAVYLVGGSSAIPLVSETLFRRLGRRPVTRNDPKAVVALGAAAWPSASMRPATSGGPPGISAGPPRTGPMSTGPMSTGQSTTGSSTSVGWQGVSPNRPGPPPVWQPPLGGPLQGRFGGSEPAGTAARPTIGPPGAALAGPPMGGPPGAPPRGAPAPGQLLALPSEVRAAPGPRFSPKVLIGAAAGAVAVVAVTVVLILQGGSTRNLAVTTVTSSHPVTGPAVVPTLKIKPAPMTKPLPATSPAAASSLDPTGAPSSSAHNSAPPRPPSASSSPSSSAGGGGVPAAWTRFSAFSSLIGSSPGDTAGAYENGTCQLVTDPATLGTNAPGSTAAVSCSTGIDLTYTVYEFPSVQAVTTITNALVAKGFSPSTWNSGATPAGQTFSATTASSAEIATSFTDKPTFVVDMQSSSAATLQTEWKNAPLPP